MPHWGCLTHTAMPVGKAGGKKTRGQLARGGCAARSLPSQREKLVRVGAPDPSLEEGVSKGGADPLAPPQVIASPRRINSLQRSEARSRLCPSSASAQRGTAEACPDLHRSAGGRAGARTATRRGTGGCVGGCAGSSPRHRAFLRGSPAAAALPGAGAEAVGLSHGSVLRFPREHRLVPAGNAARGDAPRRSQKRLFHHQKQQQRFPRRHPSRQRRRPGGAEPRAVPTARLGSARPPAAPGPTPAGLPPRQAHWPRDPGAAPAPPPRPGPILTSAAAPRRAVVPGLQDAALLPGEEALLGQQEAQLQRAGEPSR